MPGHNDLAEWLGISPQQLFRTNTIHQDRYDTTLYRDLLGASQTLRDVEGLGPAPWPALLQDVWAVYFKTLPELVPEEQIDLAHRVNRQLIQRVLEDRTTEEIRVSTVLDELAAGLAAAETGMQLWRELKMNSTTATIFDQAAAVQRAVEKGEVEQARTLAENLDHALQRHAREVRMAVRRAVDAGQQKAQEVQQVLAGWGIEPADLRRVPLQERWELLERLLTCDMRRLADQIGRLRNLARARCKDKLEHPRDEIYGVTVGADLGRLLPSELAMLRHPLRRLDFHRRMVERQLLQYSLKSREAVGRGPMAVLVDASGSMFGRKLNWASAVALALVDTAIRQKRRAMVIHFNTQVLQEVEFAPGDRDVSKLVRVATVDAGGGTNYEIPFRRALNLVEQSVYEKADIVLITDGIGTVGEEFLSLFTQRKKERKFRCWSVLIAGMKTAAIHVLSDRIWVARERPDDVAGELFEQIT